MIRSWIPFPSPPDFTSHQSPLKPSLCEPSFYCYANYTRPPKPEVTWSNPQELSVPIVLVFFLTPTHKKPLWIWPLYSVSSLFSPWKQSTTTSQTQVDRRVWGGGTWIWSQSGQVTFLQPVKTAGLWNAIFRFISSRPACLTPDSHPERISADLERLPGSCAEKVDLGEARFLPSYCG